MRRPVSAEAMAAITLAAMANPKATPRPLWNGAVIRCGEELPPGHVGRVGRGQMM